jgi:hypothetical protein
VTVAPTKRDLLELDVDVRLAGLWTHANAIKRWDLDVAAAFMRSAYGAGYSDALREPVGERGKLCTDNGYQVPK